MLYPNTLTFHLQDSNFAKSNKWQEKRGSTGAEIKDSEQVTETWLKATAEMMESKETPSVLWMEISF